MTLLKVSTAQLTIQGSTVILRPIFQSNRLLSTKVGDEASPLPSPKKKFTEDEHVEVTEGVFNVFVRERQLL